MNEGGALEPANVGRHGTCEGSLAGAARPGQQDDRSRVQNREAARIAARAGVDEGFRGGQDALDSRRRMYWLRLRFSVAASIASLRWSCSPTRRLNLPE